MEPSVAEAKRLMRDGVGKRVRAMSERDRAGASAAIVESVTGTRAFAQAKAVVGYWPLSDEPDVRGVLAQALAQGKLVCLPRVGGAGVELVAVDDLGFGGARSPLGVWEPSGGRVVAPGEVDLVLAPGVAFDGRGGRLGRGKGFFDRLLRARPSGGRGWMVCGVCFGAALVDSVPTEAHDAPVDAVATERGVLAVSRESAGLWATGRGGR